MELQVPPCSDEELLVLLDKWLIKARSRDPFALAMARAFAYERARRESAKRAGQTVPPVAD